MTPARQRFLWSLIRIRRDAQRRGDRLTFLIVTGRLRQELGL